MSIEGGASNLRAPEERNVYRIPAPQIPIAPEGRYVYRRAICASNPKPQRGDMYHLSESQIKTDLADYADKCSIYIDV